MNMMTMGSDLEDVESNGKWLSTKDKDDKVTYLVAKGDAEAGG